MARAAKKREHKKDKRAKDKHAKGQHDKPHKAKEPRQSKSVPTIELEGAGLPVSEALGASTSVAPTSVVDFWFDPVCPWTWLTSRWLLEVQEVRPVKLVWHLLSHSLMKDGADVSEDMRAELDAGWAPVRVALAVGEQFGQEQLGSFYTALGTRIHVRDEGFGREVLEAALADVGLPTELADLGYLGDNDDALRQSYGEAMELVGFESESPVTRVDGAAYFGPIFSPLPQGQRAGQVFDAIAMLDASSGFRELKRARPQEPILD
jgi:hypothetical protein